MQCGKKHKLTQFVSKCNLISENQIEVIYSFIQSC